MYMFRAALVASAISMHVFTVHAAGPAEHAPEHHWKHSGLFGTFDRAALRRGFRVYNEVCSACHGLRLVAYRNLAEIGMSVAQIKVIAADKEFPAEPNEDGEIENRPGLPSDRIQSPFPNENAARASNNGALPPDLSLIIKARLGGADYLHALLTGYKNAPASVKVPDGMHYNEYFVGKLIAMAEPLQEGSVEFSDGTKATVKQQAEDVVTFLSWAAEPELEERKRMGVKVILFLLLLTGLLYVLKRRTWSGVH
ncbi:MAG: cytochrome c1 [Pseudomonadota bacterium]|nr:cytochrome c1 [Pseudomonadota bacterium]